MGRFDRVRVIAVLGAALAGAVPVTAAQAAPKGLQWSATIDGRDVRSVDANKPLRLSPRRPAILSVRVQNSGANPIRVHSVRFEGRVLSLAFFVYTTRVDFDVAPGATEDREFSV